MPPVGGGYDTTHDDGPGFVGIRFCQEWYPFVNFAFSILLVSISIL